MLNKICQAEKDKCLIISIICEILKRKKEKNQTHRYRKQIGGFQRWGWAGEGGDGQKVQTYSDKISPGINVQHGDFS